MANNVVTLNDLTKAITHILAGAPDQNVTATELVNDAISHFAIMAPWRWRQKALSIGSTNGQNFISLPSDFEELVLLKKVNDTTNNVEPVSLDQIINARQSGVTTLAAGLWYCLDWTPQASVGVEPTAILQLYPTPTATTNPYLVGTYLRQIPKLVNNTDEPDLPSAYHPILKVWCRAYAMQYETSQRGADWQTFLDMLPMAERMDGRSPGYVGTYRGGLNPRRGRSLAAQTDVIQAPP
jgi:hypothetical protein